MLIFSYTPLCHVADEVAKQTNTSLSFPTSAQGNNSSIPLLGCVCHLALIWMKENHMIMSNDMWLPNAWNSDGTTQQALGQFNAVEGKQGQEDIPPVNRGLRSHVTWVSGLFLLKASAHKLCISRRRGVYWAWISQKVPSCDVVGVACEKSHTR